MINVKAFLKSVVRANRVPDVCFPRQIKVEHPPTSDIFESNFAREPHLINFSVRKHSSTFTAVFYLFADRVFVTNPQITGLIKTKRHDGNFVFLPGGG